MAVVGRKGHEVQVRHRGVDCQVGGGVCVLAALRLAALLLLRARRLRPGWRAHGRSPRAEAASRDAAALLPAAHR